MRKLKTYQIFSRGLLLSLILSVVFPSGSYAMNHLLCSSQMAKHHSAKDNTQASDHCMDLSGKFSGHTFKTIDSGQGAFDCECADTQVPDFSDAQITPKVNLSAAALLMPADEVVLSDNTAAKHLRSEKRLSFSPPPIFLINSSFLN